MISQWIEELKKVEGGDPELWERFKELSLKKSSGRYPSPEVVAIIDEAYAHQYHLDARCDGCTCVSELWWPKANGFGSTGKNPACVGHDYLYSRGWHSRLYCDLWFYSATMQMGNRWRGFLRFLGVRFGGWRAWRKHRQREKNF